MPHGYLLCQCQIASGDFEGNALGARLLVHILLIGIMSTNFVSRKKCNNVNVAQIPFKETYSYCIISN